MILPTTDYIPVGAALEQLVAGLREYLALAPTTALALIGHRQGEPVTQAVLAPATDPAQPVPLQMVPYEVGALAQPVDAVTNLVRGLNYQRISAYADQIAADDAHRVMLHDLALISSGFGIFALRSSFRYETASCGMCSGASCVRQTALDQAAIAFGLAYWVQRQAADHRTVRRHLAGTHKALYQRSYRYVARRLGTSPA